MMTISNSLSFFRAPLAFLFLQGNPSLRLMAIVLAMVTDSIDGYLARKYQSTSRFGAILDPAMDKFFVYFALSMFFVEHKIDLWEIAAMISRDFFLCIYGLWLVFSKKLKTTPIRSVRWGKITTILQFTVLIGLVYGIEFPSFLFIGFILMGILTMLEFFFLPHPNKFCQTHPTNS